MLKAALTTVLVAMLPVLELRGAIPVGLAGGLGYWETFCLAVIGNMLPIPFLIVFARRLLSWLARRFDFMHRFVDAVERRAVAKAENIRRYQLLGLMILVAIPLPGTGAWTGALVATVLEMRMRRALPVIFLGVLIAGVIVTIVSYSAVAVFF